MTAALDVRCRPAGDGWTCSVRVGEDGNATEHEVTVSSAELDRFAAGRDAQTLVVDSFRFLLEREPREAIMRRFELSAIERYFPDYPATIARR